MIHLNVFLQKWLMKASEMAYILVQVFTFKGQLSQIEEVLFLKVFFHKHVTLLTLVLFCSRYTA